ncbi:Lrp/AsnC family transcriptional regulator [Nocardiopsis sp. CNT-189]|uniref:Lrp/AsnC family transcriptional regulator n=1 Tax=Nocardiopsis oceanisediminis TaxID=2816862 RepID=UPI003B2CD19B
MGAVELDETDGAIVRELRADGRLPFEALAARVGLSRAAARLRVRRMQEAGRLKVVGVVHPAVRGTDALALVSVDVNGATSAVAGRIAELPGTASVHLTAGRFPLAAQVRARDLAGLSAAVARVRGLPGVVRTAAAVCTEVLKDPRMAAAAPPDIVPDGTDLLLLDLLERDGRLPFAELAGHAGLSAGAVRTRVLRLLDSGALRVTAELAPAAAGLRRHGGFALRLLGPAETALHRAAEWREVRFLARCLGGNDMVGTAAAASLEELRDLFERLRGLPGIRLTETWVHLSRVEVPGLRPALP